MVVEDTFRIFFDSSIGRSRAAMGGYENDTFYCVKPNHITLRTYDDSIIHITENIIGTFYIEGYYIKGNKIINNK
jgi:hypothetical protein